MADDLPQELVSAQQKALSKLENARVRRFLTALEEARRELQDAIASAGESEFQAARLPQLLGQIDAIEAQTTARLGRESGTRAVGDMARDHSLQGFSALEPGLSITLQFNFLDAALLERFATANLANITGRTASQINAIRAVLLNRVGVRGMSPSRVARELAGKEGMFTGQYARVETILRTETSTIYNAHKLAATEEANALHGLAFNNRIIETMDLERNHPISRAINGLVQAPGLNFVVPVAKVNAAAAAMGRKSTGGIFWIQKSGFYVGRGLPAHYNERGTVVPSKKPVNVDMSGKALF